MMWSVLASVALCLSFTGAAQANIDAQLEKYIQQFGLRPLANAPTLPLPKRRLGQMLFTERALSGNNNITCMECHSPATLTHDALPLSVGEGAEGVRPRMQLKGHLLPRNSQALFNLSNQHSMFWDGRVSFDPESKTFITPELELRADIRATLTSAVAAQALFPLVDEKEMRGAPGTNEIADANDNHEAWELLLKRLMATPRYQKAFAEVFPGEVINIGHVGEALAAFFTTQFHFNDTPYDRYLKGDKSALSEVQKQGMELFFNKASCGNCHSGEDLSNHKFANVGVPQIGPGKTNGDDLGRGEVTTGENTQWAFRVPTLRNVLVTAPYGHSGAFNTIREVVDHYDDVVVSLTTYQYVAELQNYVERIETHNHARDAERLLALSLDLRPKLFLEELEKEALVEFVSTGLTDYRFINKQPIEIEVLAD